MGVQIREHRYGLLAVPLTPAAVAADESAEQTFPVGGLRVSDFVAVVKPTLQAGIFIAGARVSAPGVLAIAFANVTAAGITPTPGERYLVHWFRHERGSNLPTSVAD